MQELEEPPGGMLARALNRVVRASTSLVLVSRCQSDGVTQVRVAFQEADALDLVLLAPGVLEDVEPVADVDHVDEAVLDYRIAPHRNLVRSAVEGRVLGRDRRQRLRAEPARLTRVRRIRDVDRLQPAGVPGADDESR